MTKQPELTPLKSRDDTRHIQAAIHAIQRSKNLVGECVMAHSPEVARLLSQAAESVRLRDRICDAERLDAAEWLRRGVESMSDLPAQHAFCAYTHRRTPFTIICNGRFKAEGAPAYITDEPPMAVARMALRAAEELRNRIDGPALLTWRALPAFEVDDDGRTFLYMRLAFEPDLWS